MDYTKSIKNLIGYKKENSKLNNLNAPVIHSSVFQRNYPLTDLPKFSRVPETTKDTSTLPNSMAEMPHHRQSRKNNVYTNTSMIRKRVSQKSPPKGGKSQRRRKHRKTVKKGYFW